MNQFINIISHPLERLHVVLVFLFQILHEISNHLVFLIDHLLALLLLLIDLLGQLLTVIYLLQGLPLELNTYILGIALVNLGLNLVESFLPLLLF